MSILTMVVVGQSKCIRRNSISSRRRSKKMRQRWMRVTSRRLWRSKRREDSSRSLNKLELKVISRNRPRFWEGFAPKRSRICRCIGGKRMVNFDLVTWSAWGIKRIFFCSRMQTYQNLLSKRSQEARCRKLKKGSPTTSTKVCSIQMVWQIKASRWSHKQVKTPKMQATCSNNASSVLKLSKIVKSTRETQIFRPCELSLKRSWRRW